jgi:hypothetical protein
MQRNHLARANARIMLIRLAGLPTGDAVPTLTGPR